MADFHRLSLLALVLGGVVLPTTAAEPKSGTVTAVLETEKVDEDPDDPAIWVNSEDPAKSRVLGTDKDYGLLVFDLEGRILQRFPDGRLNNVDVRTGVNLDG